MPAASPTLWIEMPISLPRPSRERAAAASAPADRCTPSVPASPASAASPWISRRAPAAWMAGNSRRANRACSSSGKSFSRTLIQRQPAAMAAATISASGRRAWRRSVTRKSAGSGIRERPSVAATTSQSEDVFEKPLGCKFGFFVGTLFGRTFGRGKAVLGAAVEVEFPRHVCGAQLIEQRDDFRHRRGGIFGAVQNEHATVDLLRRVRGETTERAVDCHGAEKRRACLRQLDRNRAAETIADNRDLAR